ncbi:uncharacterized protein LOC129883666 [Solanum dulcamara]|uniref:uncharacterized protein LOC129883666 n=1 Tax=Solanum dulcamara TaxID=45834 RepID=UPI0024857462|nr:uncharacterized protein LOC129883666 [Solanum dulcamara]
MANKNKGKSIESSDSIDDYNKRLVPNISLDILTESLGFESFNEKSKCIFDEIVEAAERRSRSRSNTNAKEEIKSTTNAAVRDFPPLLSSLYESGRPRFNLEKVRENGRLQISSVKNTRPEVIVERTPPGADHEESDGRVRIKFIDGKTDCSSSSSSSGKEE